MCCDNTYTAAKTRRGKTFPAAAWCGNTYTAANLAWQNLPGSSLVWQYSRKRVTNSVHVRRHATGQNICVHVFVVRT